MKLFSFIAVLVVFVTLSYGQQPIVLTLNKAVELALEKNVSVIQSQNNVDASRSGYLAAIGSYLPTLTASAGWGRNQSETPAYTTVSPSGYRWVTTATDTFYVQTSLRQIEGGGKDVSTSYTAGVDLSYTIFDGFRREANLSGKSATLTVSEQTAVRTQQAIRYQIEAAYLNVLRDEQLVKVNEENLKRDRQQLERITESNRVGALSLADVYRQQSQVAADELNVINAQNTFDKAKADLVALIGLDIQQEYSFADPSFTTEISQQELDSWKEKSKNLEQYYKQALESRPDYIASKASYDASQSGVTSARSGYIPQVRAYAGYSLANSEFSKLSENKSINWGINLSWNIFDAFQTNQSMQSAIVSRNNSEVYLRQTERDISVEVMKALLDIEAARKGVEVSQKGLKSATEDQKIAEEKYNLGAGTLLDLLTANASYVNAAANLINSSFSYITAQRNLDYVIGGRSK
jgi:outer membrane protein